MPNLTVARIEQFPPRQCTVFVGQRDPENPPPEIKQRVASLYTAKVYGFKRLPVPPHAQREQLISAIGNGPHHVSYGRPSQPQIDCLFRFPNFPQIVEWWGSECRLWVRKLAKIGVCRASYFQGTHMNTQQDIINLRTYLMLWQSFVKIVHGRLQMEKEITRVKYNSFLLLLKQYGGD